MADQLAHVSARSIRRAAAIVAIAVMAALSSWTAVAQTLTNPDPKPNAAAPTARVKSRPAGHVKDCSIYGPGFMAMPGSDMCIKIGGGVTVEAGH
jgi:hypothetical protein